MTDPQDELKSSESSWRILAKIGLFLAVPTLIVLGVKLLLP